MDAELGFVLLADGVAGLPSGERAAETAVAAAEAHLGLALRGAPVEMSSAMALLRDAFTIANMAVQRVGARDEKHTNMATTLVGAVFVGGYAVLASVGDSRAYRLSRTSIRQVTRDHLHETDALALLSDEDKSAVRPLVQRLTRAVGQKRVRNPTFGWSP